MHSRMKISQHSWTKYTMSKSFKYNGVRQRPDKARIPLCEAWHESGGIDRLCAHRMLSVLNDKK